MECCAGRSLALFGEEEAGVRLLAMRPRRPVRRGVTTLRGRARRDKGRRPLPRGPLPSGKTHGQYLPGADGKTEPAVIQLLRAVNRPAFEIDKLRAGEPAVAQTRCY
jgi:hypothetical protein